MADLIVSAVLKSTIAWLNLQDCVVDQQLCSLIARELEQLASLNELKETIKLYSEGVSFISFAETKENEIGVISQATVGSDAKQRFGVAREKATSVFNDTALNTADRILAMYLRVKATLLEQVDDPTEALVSCTKCLEELHSMEAVQNSFSLELHKGPLKFSDHKDENIDQVVSSVRRVNRIVFDVAQLVGTDRQLLIWPSVAIGKEKIDPLHELRLGKTLCEQKQEHCSDTELWLFGEPHLMLPSGIATNSKGQFIVADTTKTKVFDSNGLYLYPIGLTVDDDIMYDIVDVDTDREDNVYLLVAMTNEDHDKRNKAEAWYKVFVFDKDGDFRRDRTFKMKDNSKGRKLTVSQFDKETEVLVLEGERELHAIVEVYKTEGTFVCHFGDRVLMDAQDVIAANNGHVYVLDKFHGDSGKCVHEFSAERKLIRSFGVDPASAAIAFDGTNEHIVIVSTLYDVEKNGYRQNVTIYDSSNTLSDNSYIDSKLVRTYEIDTVRVLLDLSITVNLKGLIAVALAQDFNGELQGKVVVMKETTKR